MSAPADYDAAVVDVTPTQLWELANDVKRASDALSGHVSTIFNALRDLQTGWDSDSAAEARSFLQLLSASCDDVFGTDGTDGAKAGGGAPEGVVNLYLGFLQAAADGFDGTEKAITKSWNDFNAGFDSSGGGDDGSGPGSDPTRTAITWEVAGR